MASDEDRTAEEREPVPLWEYDDDVAPDADLADFVQFANAFGLEADVVLTLPGQVIGGTLISGHSHYEQLSGAIRYLPPGVERTKEQMIAVDNVTDMLDLFAERYKSQSELLAEDSPAREPLAPVAFVHLKNAYTVQGHERVWLGLWRGRLSAVSAWTFGSVTFDANG